MRFVIQHHLDKNEHYDLMIEVEESDKLFTLKISAPDMDLLLDKKKINADRLPDHRKVYLDYEGPVSRGRGNVEIFDSGVCRTVMNTKYICEFEISGEKFNGKFVINKTDSPTYYIQYFFNR